MSELTGRQGCALLPCPFLFALDFIHWALDEQGCGLLWGKKHLLTDLAFVKNMALHGKTKNSSTALEHKGLKIGLRINTIKIQIMLVGYICTNMPLHLSMLDNNVLTLTDLHILGEY